MNKLQLLAVTVGAVYAFSMSSASATTIDFHDGLTTSSQPGGTTVGSYFAGWGVVMPNLRFHNSAYSGNVPFNFTDGWGAVVDYGLYKTNVGYINFTNPVDYIQIDGMAQSSFNLGGVEPYSWYLLVYNTSNSRIGSITDYYGFDFAGTPNPPNIDPYPLALVSLRLDAPGLISRVEIYADGKVGLDTVSFGVSAVPEPSVLLMTLTGLAAIGVFVRERI